MKKLLYILLLILLILLSIGFAGFNSGQVVSFKFLGLRLENEFWVFVLASLLLGVLIGYIFATLKGMKHRVKARNLNKQLSKVEKEVSSLKDISAIEKK